MKVEQVYQWTTDGPHFLKRALTVRYPGPICLSTSTKYVRESSGFHCIYYTNWGTTYIEHNFKTLKRKI